MILRFSSYITWGSFYKRITRESHKHAVVWKVPFAYCTFYKPFILIKEFLAKIYSCSLLVSLVGWILFVSLHFCNRKILQGKYFMIYLSLPLIYVCISYTYYLLLTSKIEISFKKLLKYPLDLMHQLDLIMCIFTSII